MNVYCSLTMITFQNKTLQKNYLGVKFFIEYHLKALHRKILDFIDKTQMTRFTGTSNGDKLYNSRVFATEG